MVEVDGVLSERQEEPSKVVLPSFLHRELDNAILISDKNRKHEADKFPYDI